MPCYSPLKGFKDEETGGITFRRDNPNMEEMEVSCGQCLGCRLDRSRMWAMRCMHEASLHESDNGSCFITLTYDDEHLPGDWSLNKKHFQDFMKRLRKKFPQRIRYFHCGEYGEICQHETWAKACPCCNVGRPHYHAILFNIRFKDLEPISSDGLFTSQTLAETWGKGMVSVGECTPQSAGYVARYALKKINGLNKDDHYQWMDHETGEITYVHQEYATMSRRPGIGKEWYDKFKSDMFPSDETPVPGMGVIPGVPRYYQKLFEQEEPETLEAMKEQRLKFRDAHANEYSSDRLMDKYKVKLAQIKSLTREL